MDYLQQLIQQKIEVKIKKYNEDDVIQFIVNNI